MMSLSSYIKCSYSVHINLIGSAEGTIHNVLLQWLKTRVTTTYKN